jgi:hypothetical protein
VSRSPYDLSGRNAADEWENPARAAEEAVVQLRADLERVTAERDRAKLAGEAALVHAQRELAETKAALEEANADLRRIAGGVKQVRDNADLPAFFHHVRSCCSGREP